MKMFRLLAATAGMGTVLRALMADMRTAKVVNAALPKGMYEGSTTELLEAQSVVAELERVQAMAADLKDVLVVLDATSDIAVVDRPEIVAFHAGEQFLTRLLEAQLLCKSNDLSEVRLSGNPIQWGNDLFTQTEQLPSVMGQVVDDRRGDFRFCDERKNDNGQVASIAVSIVDLVSKVLEHQADGLVVMTQREDAQHSFSVSRCRFETPGGVVIWSESESGYWNNDVGWTGLDEANVFTRVEKSRMALPMSTASDACWIDARTAVQNHALDPALD